MPKQAKELSPLEVRRLTEPGFYAVGVPAGLYLAVSERGARSWILRKRIAGKRRDMGLGGFPSVTLAGAQERARELAKRIAEGFDPLAEKRQRQASALAAAATARTFRQAADAYIASHEATWSNAKHAGQWRATLETYVHPAIGALPVALVERVHVLAILEPIWTEKPETAARLRSRIELILGHAMQRDWRPQGLNPARWRDNLDAVLPARSKVAPVENHPAVPVAEVGAFMQRLRGMPGMGARALEFVALTACRSGEARGALWSEIDLDAGLWTIPAARMKGRREHRVPLAPQAVALLRALPRKAADEAGAELVFPGTKGNSLSDMSLSAVMRRMGMQAVPHGLRSTFRDWVAERTTHPRELAEAALAHVLADKTEAAYQRGDMLERRRQMMAQWADYLDATQPARAQVLTLATRAA